MPRSKSWESRSAAALFFSCFFLVLPVMAQNAMRPVVRLDGVTGVSFESVTFPRAAGVPVLSLRNVSGLDIHRGAGLPDTIRTVPVVGEDL